VDTELIDKQMEGYANRFGENVPAEQIGEKETAIGDFVHWTKTAMFWRVESLRMMFRFLYN